MANPKTIARLEGQIQRRVAHSLQFELSDPRSAFVTLTRVELSKDLSVAKIHYSVLGDEGDKSKAAHMLEHANGFIRKQLSSSLHTRTLPQLRWIYDDSVEEAARIDRLIRDARARDAEIRGEQPEADPE